MIQITTALRWQKWTKIHMKYSIISKQFSGQEDHIMTDFTHAHTADVLDCLPLTY
jgi:hypothetical protein